MRARTREIHDFILGLIPNSEDIAAITAGKFGISRQAIHRHLQQLVKDGMIEVVGESKRKKYQLRLRSAKTYKFNLKESLSEDSAWAQQARPFFTHLASSNVYEILHYGFTELFNNAIDHSEGDFVEIGLYDFSTNFTLTVADDGVGIFRKIQKYLNLDDPRQALLELAKGKMTSDPDRHSGEGIFFTSRMCDLFTLDSQSLVYTRFGNDDWLLENRENEHLGTKVTLQIKKNSTKTPKEIFSKYASEADDYGFTRTHVPVNLAIYEGDNLVSRSQAKRLLARIDRFREVILDFRNVKEIGPAFADEIFRVFANAHPSINLIWINADKYVLKMINRAKSTDANQQA